ncbi:MAG: PAS domain S-box protein, partial [Acidobacteriota bacterium]
MFFWIVESAVDTHMAGSNSSDFLEFFFTPSLHDLYMRLIVVGLIVLLSLHAHGVTSMWRRMDERLVRTNERLEREIAGREAVEKTLREVRDELELKVEELAEELFLANSHRSSEIKKRVQAEASLRISGEQLRAVFDTVQAGIVIIDADTHHVVDANRSAAKMVGIPKKRLIGQECHRFICPAEKGQCPITDLSQKLDNSERRLLRADGSTAPIVKTVAPLQIGGRRLLLESFIDIGSLKATEELNKRLETQLRQALRLQAVGSLAGGISHDFNNILMAIFGYAEMALMKCPESGPVRKSLLEILKAGGRARDLVAQILAFSRRSEQEGVPSPVGPIVKETLKLLRASLPATIVISQSIETDAMVRAEPSQLSRIVVNLCADNHQGARRLDVIVRDGDRPESGSFVELIVALSGMEQPFDSSLAPVSSGAESPEPSTVREIVSAVGGMFEVRAEPGKGISFHVWLPTVELAERDTGGSEGPRSGCERILLVDDEEMIALSGGKMLADEYGYEVTVKTDGAEALDLFA